MTAVWHGAAALVSAAAGIAGVAGMLGWRWTLVVPWLVPLGGLELGVDPLAGFFLAVVGLVGIPVSVYGLGYADASRGGGVAYLAFLAAMAMVPLAGNLMTFALAWEAMSLASWFLVVQDRGDASAIRAGWVYGVMTHAGLACLLAGMLLLTAWSGSMRFADWPAAAATLSPVARSAVFVLLALGFASKAGVIPLHVWLPLAHPAAPSHVSALMSGVMIKLGVYGLFRAAFEWCGPPPAWWGTTLLLAGAVSAVVGVLYALVDHDLKRLLAFHSIENVGIILIGLGAGIVFQHAGVAALAVLGAAAALYHTVNHAVFKALLFLGAGAVVHATGSRNMEEMGGLIKRMPWTAGCFLVGAAAIAALPPLNGFVSEWLTFQALLQGVRLPHAGLNIVFVLGTAGLALTGGLAMACFVKAFGITFLALPRSEAAAQAHEAPVAMRIGMVILGAGCAVLGLGATVVTPALAAVARHSLRTDAAPAFGDWLTLHVSGDFASLSTPVVAVALVVAAVVPATLLAAAGLRRGRRYETWGCGRMLQTARMEYTATAFSNPFKRVFEFLYRPVHATDVETHPDSRFFFRTIHYHHETRSLAEDWLYRPVLETFGALTERVRLMQSGRANVYLVYILAALVAVLVLA